MATARNYDFILTVANTTNYVNNNTLVGVSSGTGALIVNVNHDTSTLRVKIGNAQQEFIVGEFLHSNVSVLQFGVNTASYTNTSPYINGVNNTFTLPTLGVNNHYFDSTIVTMNGVRLPTTMWTFANNNTQVKINNLRYTKIPQTDIANLKVHLSEMVKDSFYDPKVYISGSRIPDTRISVVHTSTIAEDFSYIMPDADLERYLVGDTGSTVFEVVLPLNNIATLNVSLAYGNTAYSPFYPGYKSGELLSANSNIISIAYSTFIGIKNAFQIPPVVRLYTVYYPGEWYPPNEKGNPNSDDLGTQFAWPAGFPLRFAEIRGDYVSDLFYKVQFGGTEYRPYPTHSSDIGIDSTGKINDVTLMVSNFDGLITALIENPYLCGFNSSNNAPGIRNGEIVFNIDPRTNPSNVHFDESYTDTLGQGYNVAWEYTTTRAIGDEWTRLKQDSRDLLGAVVEIKTTFANMLDYWPEYSSIIEKSGQNIKMRNLSSYRVGDIVHNNANDMVNAASVVTQIIPPYLVVNTAGQFVLGDNLYIKNIDANPEEFVLDTFKINNLEALNEKAAQFSLTSWLQYFKNMSPPRVFHKNTCVWIYKGQECQYPQDGTGNIPGSRESANGFFTITNESTLDPGEDVCAKNALACSLRKNDIHFGGFPATGVSVPR